MWLNGVISCAIRHRKNAKHWHHANMYINDDFPQESKLRVTGLCAGNAPMTGEFPAQRPSNAEMFPFLTASWITDYMY